LLADYRETLTRHAGFTAWLREETAPEGEEVLLVTRWLCHLAGYRHRTVQLYIMHPERPDYVFVQVRGLTRPEAPGNFDSPVAGHVPGLADPAAIILAELAEEIGLSPEDVRDLRLTTTYNYLTPDRTELFYNNEYRAVFTCRLAPEAWPRLRFPDAEVAAICIFAVGELAALIERYPERVASGLRASFGRLFPAGSYA
jgi:isopentenyldiphosphate isomerase